MRLFRVVLTVRSCPNGTRHLSSFFFILRQSYPSHKPHVAYGNSGPLRTSFCIIGFALSPFLRVPSLLPGHRPFRARTALRRPGPRGSSSVAAVLYQFSGTTRRNGMTHREIGKLPSSMYTRIIETGRSTVHYTYKRYPSVISSGRVAVAAARNQQFLLHCAYARTYVRWGRGCRRDRSHPGKKETRRARYGEGVVCGVRASGKKKLREKSTPNPTAYGSKRVANRNCAGAFQVVSSQARRIRYIMTFMFIGYESTSHYRPGHTTAPTYRRRRRNKNNASLQIGFV